MLVLEYSAQPSPYWVYESKILKDIYDEIYSAVEWFRLLVILSAPNIRGRKNLPE